MRKIIKLLVVGFLIFSCSNDSGNDGSSNCDFDTLSGVETYQNSPSDFLTINSLTLEGDCLKVNFSSSGCDGNSWEVKLVDSGLVQESSPPRRNIRLSLKNEELCEAFIRQELTFNVSNLQVDGNTVLLRLVNSDDEITYEY